MLIWTRRIPMQMRVLVGLAVAECSWHVLYRIRWLRLQSISWCTWPRSRTHGYLKRFIVCVRSVVELVGRRSVPLGRPPVRIHERVVCAVVVLLIWVCKPACSDPLSQLHSSLRLYMSSTMRDICERARATAQGRAEWGTAEQWNADCFNRRITFTAHLCPPDFTCSCLASSRRTPALHLFWRPPTYHTDCTPCWKCFTPPLFQSLTDDDAFARA